MPKKLCLRCGSSKLDDAQARGWDPGLESKNAKKVLGVVWHVQPIDRAEVCLDCGFISYFVNPEAYRRRLKEDSTKGK